MLKYIENRKLAVDKRNQMIDVFESMFNLDYVIFTKFFKVKKSIIL